MRIVPLKGIYVIFVIKMCYDDVHAGG